MKIDLNSILPEDFSEHSKVWIYQSNRIFLLSEAFQIEEMLEHFLADWKSHGAPVKGYANLFYGQFIIIMADEAFTQVGGCSTDASVRLIKAIEQKMQVNLFDRQTLAFVIKDKIELLPLSQISYAFEKGFISPETLFFNNVVLNKKELVNQWLTPIKNTWLMSRIDAVIRQN